MSALDAGERESAALRERIATLSAAILRIGASLDFGTVLRAAVDGALSSPARATAWSRPSTRRAPSRRSSPPA